MKKAFILLLCVMLALPAAVQAKTFGYTIPELIGRQLDAQSSLRMQLTAEAAGEAPAFADAQTWKMLKALLPGLQLNGTYFKSKSQATSGNEQIKAELVKGEETLSTLILTGKDDLWLLETDLLPGKVYSLSRDPETAYLNFSQPEAGTWPDILRMFVLIEEAGAEYAQQLDQLLYAHMAEINRWLQSYTKVTMKPDAQGNVQLSQEIRIPAEEVKKQIKEMLKDLYADRELIALLRTILPAADAEAYLESGMLPLFNQVIDAAALEGEVVVNRAYDGAGLWNSESITLPFVAGTGLREVKIEKGAQSSFSVTLSNGICYALTVNSENDTYSGEISITLAQGKSFKALYTLSLSLGAEQYIEENTSRERDQKIEAVLLLQPETEGAFNAQTLSLSVHLTAGASSTKPAYIDATLGWRDMVAGSSFTLHAAGNTSAGLRQSEVDAALATQADTLPRADRAELLNDMVQQLQTALAGIVNRLLPSDSAP